MSLTVTGVNRMKRCTANYYLFDKRRGKMALLIILIILAIIAAAIGFSGIASAAIIAFWVLLGLLVLWLIVRLVTGHWLFTR